MDEDLRVIDGTSDFHIFKSGERVTIIQEFPRGKYWVENKDGKQDIVLEEHTCGGTACGC